MFNVNQTHMLVEKSKGLITQTLIMGGCNRHQFINMSQSSN